MKELEQGSRASFVERYGEVPGYAIFLVNGDWADPFPANRVRVTELIAADPDAVAGVWSYLLSIDLAANPRAVAVVDELAAIPLGLYARDRGFTKITPNLMGF